MAAITTGTPCPRMAKAKAFRYQQFYTFLKNQKDVPMALVQNKDVKNDEACKELYKLMYGDNVTVRPISVYEMISTPESSA